MMKWLCVAAVLANLVLFAFAGFKFLTVTPEQQRQADQRVSRYLDRHLYGTESEPTDTRPRVMIVEPDDAPPPREPDAEVEPAPENDGTITGQTPAMNMEVFGVSRESARLREIETKRNELNEAGAEALEE